MAGEAAAGRDCLKRQVADLLLHTTRTVLMHTTRTVGRV
jgi:hypothetical protein